MRFGYTGRSHASNTSLSPSHLQFHFSCVEKRYTTSMLQQRLHRASIGLSRSWQRSQTYRALSTLPNNPHIVSPSTSLILNSQNQESNTRHSTTPPTPPPPAKTSSPSSPPPNQPHTPSAAPPQSHQNPILKPSNQTPPS